MSGLPYLDADDLQVLFGYKTKNSFYAAISRGKFPVATYIMAGRRVADREVVRQFFERKRQEGIDRLKAQG